jgi:tetratricopeptide (TPR) repeat protein
MAVQDDIARAYALDREGREHDAIRYYERAWQQGIPDDERRHFIVGFGSTLRNVGRADEAVALLADAVNDDPLYAPYSAFLGLALLAAGNAAAAVATMLGIVFDHAPDALDTYGRALNEYHQELLAAATKRH